MWSPNHWTAREFPASILLVLEHGLIVRVNSWTKVAFLALYMVGGRDKTKGTKGTGQLSLREVPSSCHMTLLYYVATVGCKGD